MSALASSWRTALPWPIATIDFEASSLDGDSYTIEVGVALWATPDKPVLGWSVLIRMAGEWVRQGHWSVAPAKMHGIRGAELQAHGHAPSRVAALNKGLGYGGMAWCDRSPYDAHCAGVLFRAAGIRPAPRGPGHRDPACGGHGRVGASPPTPAPTA